MNYAEAELVAATIPDCQCDRCRHMCTHPCWPTIGEARVLIALGYAGRLMQSHGVIMPAHHGFERRVFQRDWLDAWYDIPMSRRDSVRCTFYSDAGGCELHSLMHNGRRVKPLEARIATHDEGHTIDMTGIHERLLKKWAQKPGRRLVNEWRMLLGYGTAQP